MRKGLRPRSVTSFAAILGAVACWNFGVDLQRALAEPEEASRIALVSRASAGFLIPVIPAAAVWLYGSRIARWFVTIASAGFAVWKLAMAARWGLPDAEGAVRFAIGLAMNAMVGLLFTPSARHWFAAGGADDARISR